MNCASCDICVYPDFIKISLVCLCSFLGVFLSSRVTGACPVATDLIMRVNARTTTSRESRAMMMWSQTTKQNYACQIQQGG